MSNSLERIAKELLKIATEEKSKRSPQPDLSDDYLILDKRTDMSLIRFIQWLNENFKKESGKEFTAQDAYGYIKRGNLPYHMGVYKITEIEIQEMGFKVIRVEKLD